MAAFLITTAVLLGILYVGVGPKRGRRFCINLAFLFLGYVLLALASFDVQVPSPVELLGRLMGI